MEFSFGAWLHRTLEDLLPPTTQRLWVAYSGGLDSHVLLHALAAAYAPSPHTSPLLPRKTLHAIHVHHGLQPEADAWVRHAETVCRGLQVPLTVCYVNPQHFSDHSPEAAAREARYQAFAAHLDTKTDVLVLAHHLDDQAETLLHRLCRGTGVLGLAGMQAFSRNRYGVGMARPLLSVPRDTLRAYAEQHALHWVEDSSNQDTRFDRNFIRHQLLPLITQRWPRAPRAFSRTARLCREAQALITQQATQDLATVTYVSEAARGTRGAVPEAWLAKEQAALGQAKGDGVSVKKLLALPSGRRRAVLRVWLHAKGLASPNQAHLARIEREILGAYAGGKPRLKVQSYEIRRWRDLLFVCSA